MAHEAGWYGITVIVPNNWHRTSGGEGRSVVGRGLDKVVLQSGSIIESSQAGKVRSSQLKHHLAKRFTSVMLL